MPKPNLAIFGSGPAALLAAEQLCKHFDVHIYEKGKTIGRKFLVAGKGGFNLTNVAKDEALYSQYTNNNIIKEALRQFNCTQTRSWLKELGIPTYVGSSGRVFPEKDIKPAQVLQQIKDKLISHEVRFHYFHEFVGFDDKQQPVVQTESTRFTVNADFYIFALGGASWSVTGSNKDWLQPFAKLGIKTIPFEASNCGVDVLWPENFKNNYAGTYLKNIQVSAGLKVRRGELTITEYGLEGNALYPLIPSIRSGLKTARLNEIHIDLKPNNTHHQLIAKTKGKKISTKNYAYEFNLTKTALAMTKLFTPKENYISPERFVEILKSLVIPISALRPIEESISTVGGISLSEINNSFALKQNPNTFIIGEMLDWDAPTGGFLLQGCFSSAYVAASNIRQLAASTNP
jgi:uncharacterized flavoprotein (TIGR03862 family)